MSDDFIEPDEVDLTDRSLMRRFRVGEEDAATAIYLRYAEKLQRLARSQTNPNLEKVVDTEGIVQSVFRTFFRRASSGQYQILSGDELWKLLLVIALNKIRNAANFHQADKRAQSRTQPLQGVDEKRISGKSPGSENAIQVLQMTIDELIVDYPQSQRQMIRLRIEGCTVEEIARQTGRAKRSIERTLQQFRDQLRSQLDET